MHDFTTQPIIVMGASAGGVSAMLELAATPPRDFPAPIVFVQHIGAHRSELFRPACSTMAAPACVEADHVVPLAALGPLLYERARRLGVVDMPQHPTALAQEHAASTGGNAMQTLKAIASPSVFTCPDCGGVLFELNDKRPVPYRCHTGHAFSLRTLAHLQEEMSDAALWASLRVLQEKEAVLRRLAQARRWPRQMSLGMRCARPTRLPTCAKQFSSSPRARPTPQ